MKRISNNDIARAIYLVSKDYNHNDQALVLPLKNKFQFLARKRLLSEAPEILASLEKIINDHEGIIVAKVSSRDMLDEKTDQKLSEIFNQTLFGENS